MCVKPVADALESAGDFNNGLAMLDKDIRRKVIRVTLKVETNRLVCSVTSEVGVLVSGDEPLISRVVFIDLHPVRVVTSNRVGITARYCSFRGFLSVFCIVAFIEFAVNDCTARAIYLNRCDSLSFENPLHTFGYVGCYAHNLVVFKLSYEQCWYFLHSSAPLISAPQLGQAFHSSTSLGCAA